MDDMQDIELRLWDYIDGTCHARERSVIENLIIENALWREKYAELLEVHQLINTAELEEPSLRFTKNVMEEIAKYQIAPATKEYINKKVIWSIAAFFITAIVGFVIYSFTKVNWAVHDTQQYTGGIDLSKINYSSVFTNTYINAFMMLNVILGLMLLDRFLSDKKKKLAAEP